LTADDADDADIPQVSSAPIRVIRGPFFLCVL